MDDAAPPAPRAAPGAPRRQLALAGLAGLLVLSLALAGCTSTQASGTPATATRSGASSTTTAPTAYVGPDGHPTGTATAAPGTTAPTGPDTHPSQGPPASDGPRAKLGTVAPGQPIATTGTCPCGGMQFDLNATAPAGKTAWLELRVRWDGTLTPGILPLLVPPGGNRTLPAQRGFDDWRIQAFAPAAGKYHLDLQGNGSYALDVAFRVLGEVRSPGDLRLPDLVTLIPDDVHIAGCDPVETSEQGATKCLRLANGIGNVGDGPAEAHLFFDAAGEALVGEASGMATGAPILEGNFTQWVYHADGTHTTHPASAAYFHPTHKHWHYSNLANFQLFKYDPATGLRGALVSSHHKQGFCFLDWNFLQSNDTTHGNAAYDSNNCQLPGDQGWGMGISKGFYDYYESDLTDEYVDVGHVPDGIYELVSTADGDHSLEQINPTDNSASVVLHLFGDNAVLLAERGHYIAQEYPFYQHPH